MILISPELGRFFTTKNPVLKYKNPVLKNASNCHECHKSFLSEGLRGD